MHVHNDFFGYVIMELVENLLLGFEEADDDWKMHREGSDTANTMRVAFATIFLNMLATLKRNDSDSEVKTVGTIVGLFVRFIVSVEEYGIDWDDHGAKIEAYAAKHDITIHGSNHTRYKRSSGESMEMGG
ncbi:hypothetical protein N7447_006699 [Penicillium robsamsonii]|uniref:uncharacterized protein n=1 Tax=Penicillium robsamsonii TaxID=1792511 RepID=UPI002547901E|nr:uncharacterized protein N7447_006699 [Penicillium robsamsonii]KAJ5824359.1 hypothetical protein N7447_006699 [Penicillium robsamsonii]